MPFHNIFSSFLQPSYWFYFFNLAKEEISNCVSKFNLFSFDVIFVANLNDLIKLYASIAFFISSLKISDSDTSFIEFKSKQCCSIHKAV